MLSRLVALLMFGCFALPSSTLAQADPDWTRPFPPFRIIGNIYWVGSYDLSTYLITTPQGNILINTGVGDTAKQIKASVEQLGFKLSDTKILTATHGHFDHVAGMAELKRMTGAKLNVHEGDKTYRVVIANMGSINPGVTVSGMPKYPEIGEDYARTFKAQKDMQIDVWLASHASQFSLHEKYKPGDPFNPDRFV